MRTSRFIRPTESFDGVVKLDARVTKRQGRELFQLIIDSVDHSQKFIQTTLPSVLIVTQKQFVSLQTYTEEMDHTTDRMFITPLNVMEVTIDRDIDTIPELDAVIEEAETMLAQKDLTASAKVVDTKTITKEA